MLTPHLLPETMKASTLVAATLAAFATSAMAKNVVDIELLKADIQKEVDGVHEKRAPKNVFDYTHLNLEGEQITKREPKNVYDMSRLRLETHGKAKRFVDENDQVVMDFPAPLENSVLLESILPQIQSISVFSGYIRDNKAISERTELLSESLLIIAPTDESLLTKLDGLKPWEFPLPLMNDDSDDAVIEDNLADFLSNHVVLDFHDTTSLSLGRDNSIKTKLINGKGIKIKQNAESNTYRIKVRGGRWIDVQSVRQVDNGYLFIIDDVLSKPSQ